MPSFDVVSELNMQEVKNAVDQANREITSRFDFKDTDSLFELKDDAVHLKTETDFQLKQMLDILSNKLTKRQVDIGCLEIKDPECHLKSAKQIVKLKQGIDTPTAKKIVAAIKEQKLKVQAAIQGEQIRVTGKKRDDLQEVIAFLKKGQYGVPLQYNNFRD